MLDQKTQVRAAIRARDALAEMKWQRYKQLQARLDKFTGQFTDLGSETKRFGTAVERNWLAAAKTGFDRIFRLLNDISYTAGQTREMAASLDVSVPSLRFITDELDQISNDLGEPEYDSSNNTISVTTDPVNLDGFYLGPFSIQLELDKLPEIYNGQRCYRIIALEPHPAATDDCVTHPHVSNEQLCEGDGAAAIRNALESGRLCDFFSIVTNILNTYNPDSPYVSLDDWDGLPCYDCGYVMGEGNAYFCQYCEHDYCEECSTICISCDETVCLGCVQKCSSCDEYVCPHCVLECSECGKLCCSGCIEDGICLECKQEMEAQNEENTEEQTCCQPAETKAQASTQEGQAGPAVQPDRLGQAAVFQGQEG